MWSTVRARYKSGQGLVAISWVFVRNRDGTHRDQNFATTDLSLDARQIIESYTGRSNIGTTFQVVRSGLHVGTARGWCRTRDLRISPCLFGFSTVAP